MPPLAPPNGRFMMPHFHDIHMARAATSPRSTWVIAQTALGRAARQAVLHAIADEHFGAPVVHAHRDADDHGPLGLAQPLQDALVDVDDLGHASSCRQAI